MSRPSSIWLAFVACVALLAGAFAVVTRHAIRLDHERVATAAQADAGQRIRLALWRMDSMATAILVRENARPPANYPLSEPPDDAPVGAKLYFEISADGKLELPRRSPHPADGTLGHRESLRQLLHLMDAPAPGQVGNPAGTPAAGGTAATPSKSTAADALGGDARRQSDVSLQNADLAFAAANVQQAQADPFADIDGHTMKQEDASNELKAQAAAKDGKANAPVAKPAASQEVDARKLDLSQRADVVQKSTNRYKVAPVLSKLAKRAPPAESKTAAAVHAPAAASRPAEPPATAKLAQSPVVKERGRADAGESRASPDMERATQARGEMPDGLLPAPAVAEAPVSAPTTTDSRVTSFQPVWLEGELLLVRAVGEGTRQRIQGIWLDHRELAGMLLGSIRDLLPQAALSPYEPFVFSRDNVITHAATDAVGMRNRLTAVPRSLDKMPMAMVSMPWELKPGVLPALAAAGSALAMLLALAWGGALLAILAAALLLRGVLVLSERRAAFVSSVTHELRTPLTTFTLYSEMLAEGMVADPEKQHGYLNTLRREASRLSHLVENVLAYSRIERGSARRKLEAITVHALADQLLPRLAERAASVGATIDIDLPGELGARTITTDPSAVEQIVFNLVDNAAKYAAPAADGPPWQLAISRDGNWLCLDFHDHGPGIPPDERRKLFRPFHKSAQDAANSKPGVGLGLALSRQLARALGGKLQLLPDIGRGASFRLRLPGIPAQD